MMILSISAHNLNELIKEMKHQSTLLLDEVQECNRLNIDLNIHDHNEFYRIVGMVHTIEYLYGPVEKLDDINNTMRQLREIITQNIGSKP